MKKGVVCLLSLGVLLTACTPRQITSSNVAESSSVDSFVDVVSFPPGASSFFDGAMSTEIPADTDTSESALPPHKIIPPGAVEYSSNERFEVLGEEEKSIIYKCNFSVDIWNKQESCFEDAAWATYPMTITIPKGLIIERGNINIEGEFEITGGIGNLKLAGIVPTAYYLEDACIEDTELITYRDDSGITAVLLAEGSYALSGNRTLHYHYEYSDHEGPGNIYSYALELGTGWVVCIRFYLFHKFAPLKWYDPAIFESIMASIQPYHT